MVLTADHGNAEVMFDETTGAPHTAHTTNEVPFAIINPPYEIGLKDGGALCDVAPTILQLMGLKQPEEMTGSSMIKTPVIV
jgi:2,3-bisphosphoglycerate-independent phosphoglycerate mutase